MYSLSVIKRSFSGGTSEFALTSAIISFKSSPVSVGISELIAFDEHQKVTVTRINVFENVLCFILFIISALKFSTNLPIVVNFDLNFQLSVFVPTRLFTQCSVPTKHMKSDKVCTEAIDNHEIRRILAERNSISKTASLLVVSMSSVRDL